MEATATTNAIDMMFERVRAEGRLAFIPYLTAGYPDREGALSLGVAFAAHGADLIEVGIPFSDPLGDGPTIQRSSTVALQQGMTVAGALALAGELTARLRALPVDVAPTDPSARGKRIPAPPSLVAMAYYNPLVRYGLDRFCADAAAAGLAALIVPDLPVEESDELHGACSGHGLHLVYLLAPTSTPARIAAVAARASGFIYCMAVTGVTGARSELATELSSFLARVRAQTRVPLVVGFGISRPEHLERLRGLADGAVVASALIDLIEDTDTRVRAQTPPQERAAAVAATVGAYVERMSRACSAS